VAWVVAVVLLVEAVGVAAVNWILGVVVDRQDMSLAGLDPDAMSVSSKAAGIVFGLYFVLCAFVAFVVAVRDRAPGGFGRVVLISAAVVHALLGAFALAMISRLAFLFMIVMLGLIVLLLMTYDRVPVPADTAGPAGPAGPSDVPADVPPPPEREPRRHRDEGPGPVTGPAPTTP
jgi:hypothetical protein